MVAINLLLKKPQTSPIYSVNLKKWGLGVKNGIGKKTKTWTDKSQFKGHWGFSGPTAFSPGE